MKDMNMNLPGEKEIAIYNAIIDLINEGADVNAMKVGEITNRAGIGKGTAYEYFESKEEMVKKALFFNITTQIITVKAMVEARESFKEKFICILDYMEEHKNEIRPFLWIMRLKGDSVDIPSLEEKENEIHECLGYITDLAAWFLSFGEEEGLFRESNQNYRISALLSQIVQFGFYMHLGRDENMEELKEFIYHGFLGQLN